MFETLDSKLTVLYAAKVYDNPACMTHEEFAEDYKRFKYVKRLCRRYVTTHTAVPNGDFGSERLLLNHLILLANVFGVEATVRILFVKCDNEKLWRVLKPFLWHLKYLPRVVRGVNGKNIIMDSIPLDEQLLGRIRELCSNDSHRG
jgi:hypothetical protein